MSGTAQETIHASAIVYGEHGFLLRGPPGSGKSLLTLELTGAACDGQFIRLVADDRVQLIAASGRLIARPPAAIRGLLEIRNIGIVTAPYEPACVVRGLIDLDGDAARMPQGCDAIIELLGIHLYHMVIRNGASSSIRVLHAIRSLVSRGPVRRK